MYKTVFLLVHIIWILDVLNIPQLEFLDTTVPINGLAWLLIFLVMPNLKD